MIVDTNGAVVESPDYTKGRLLQIDDQLTYVTWDECPQGTGIGAKCGELEPDAPLPTINDALEAAKTAQAQADYTAIMTDTVLES